MANKRTLKKQIRYACGDIAGECIMAKAFIPNVDGDKLDEAVIKVAQLQVSSLAHTNISFDKTPKEFANRAAYRKARREYFAKAYTSLRESFNKEILEIVKEMNAALPAKKK